MFTTAIFCFFTQVSLSYLLYEDLGKHIDETTVLVTGWKLQMVRFICCNLFHFMFVREYWISVKRIKYLTLYSEQFEDPWRAFTVSIINILSVLIVEGLNFWLLLTLTDVISIV